MTDILPITAHNLEYAAGILKDEGVVAFGTETVYGLGGDATSPKAIAKIYRAKNRPSHNPLISHFPSLEAARNHVIFNEIADNIARIFWPGPLTLILPRQPHTPICAQATNNLPKIAVRVPNIKEIRSLLEMAQTPIVAPSANLSGKISPTCAEDVYQDLNGRIDLILDSGPCQIGVESTVLDLSDPNKPTILRPGGVTFEELYRFLPALRLGGGTKPQQAASPGLELSHYAPTLPVRLNVTSPQGNEAYLAFGPNCPSDMLSFNLSPAGDLRQAAKRLYEGLHFLDKEGRCRGLTAIAVAPIPSNGMGLALGDRLKRAAAPRPT